MKLLFDRFPLRWKMTLAALTPVAIILFLVTLSAFWMINAWIVGETQDRVRNDLNTAREVLRHEGVHVEDVLRLTAHASTLIDALQVSDARTLTRELQRVRVREGLDLMTLVDGKGAVIAHGWSEDDFSPLPLLPDLIARGLAGEDLSGIVLVDGDALAREGEELAQRARVETRSARSAETRGMLLLSVNAVHGDDGMVLGVLYGGVLLNNNLALVDRIKNLVYGDARYEGIETGSATIFLGEMRVATTIRLREGTRALGTLVSAEVAEAVLNKGGSWFDRAKVVEDWYLTAYEPIRDFSGAPIGALYVGLLEAPFTDLKTRASMLILLLAALGGGAGYLIARQVAGRLSRPILELERSTHLIADGERNIPLPPPTSDEVGQLSRSFERMARALRQREEEVRSLNTGLERKVEERTALLEEKSLQLIRVQEELLRAEKLAALGEMAAGVAHEINNPAAIIRGNVEIMLMGLPPDASEREEAGEILRQTERIAAITRNMLSLAREQRPQVEPLQINSLLQDILDQVVHQVDPGKTELITRFAPSLPYLFSDGERLRQVFTNVILNGLQALAGRGSLCVSTAREEDRILVVIADNGPGIPQEHQSRIFNPFFSTRKGGTGLGLAVSYSLLQSVGGQIDLISKEGEGTSFIVSLPVMQS